MKSGILITARCGSTRLSRKHLRQSQGAPIVDVLIRRIRAALPEADVVIATADEQENRAFESLAGVKVFYGSIHNIPLRHLQAAEGLGLDAVVSVDGDDILCSPRAMRAVLDALQGGAEYAATSGLPFGMNASGYTAAFLRRSLAAHRDDVLETGWGHIFDPAALRTIHFDDIEDDERLRFTLDYGDDFDFFDRIHALLGEGIVTATDSAIVRLVRDRALWEINRGVAEEYWRHFRARRDDERRRSEAGA